MPRRYWIDHKVAPPSTALRSLYPKEHLKPRISSSPAARAVSSRCNRILEFQTELLLGGCYRQNFRQPAAHPRGIVQSHLDVRVHLSQSGQHLCSSSARRTTAAARKAPALPPASRRRPNSARRPGGWGRSKALLADAGQARGDRRTADESRRFRHRPDIESLRGTHLAPRGSAPRRNQ